MAKTIYVLNGPNLNLLGLRQPEIYGTRDAERCRGVVPRDRQSARLRDRFPPVQPRRRDRRVHPRGFLQESRRHRDQSGRLHHDSIAILDAIYGIKIPTIEIHISNIHQRDEFRHHSFVSKGAKGVICGFGIFGYAMAINGLVELIKTAKTD